MLLPLNVSWRLSNLLVVNSYRRTRETRRRVNLSQSNFCLLPTLFARGAHGEIRESHDDEKSSRLPPQNEMFWQTTSTTRYLTLYWILPWRGWFLPDEFAITSNFRFVDSLRIKSLIVLIRYLSDLAEKTFLRWFSSTLYRIEHGAYTHTRTRATSRVPWEIRAGSIYRLLFFPPSTSTLSRVALGRFNAMPAKRETGKGVEVRRVDGECHWLQNKIHGGVLTAAQPWQNSISFPWSPCSEQKTDISLSFSLFHPLPSFFFRPRRNCIDEFRCSYTGWFRRSVINFDRSLEIVPRFRVLNFLVKTFPIRWKWKILTDESFNGS